MLTMPHPHRKHWNLRKNGRDNSFNSTILQLVSLSRNIEPQRSPEKNRANVGRRFTQMNAEVYLKCKSMLNHEASPIRSLNRVL